MVTILSQILSNQKKTDYKPEEPGIPETSAVRRRNFDKYLPLIHTHTHIHRFV